MPKDSQLDPKAVRKAKAQGTFSPSKGSPTMAQSAPDGQSRNDKRQSGNRHKPGADR